MLHGLQQNPLLVLLEHFCFLCRKASLSGLCAGAMGQFVASPADLVKVHMQMEGRRRLEGKPPRYHQTCLLIWFGLIGLFCTPTFSAYEENKNRKNSRCVMQFSCCFFHSGICPCVSLASPHCSSVSFCVALCVASALNSRAIQSEACIFTAKYEHAPFFLKLCSNYFRLFSLRTKWNIKELMGKVPKAVREQVVLSR